MTMKMNKLFSILTLASAMMAFVPSAFAFTGGDIVDIRVMDDPNNGMVFNGVSRNGPGTAYYSALCTADHPLTAGDKIYIRVRMLVRNYEEVARFGREPKTWGFKEGLLGGSALYPPKLGLFMGENRQPVYAEFSDIGPSWQRSGELKTDDLGNATDADGQSNEKKWCYFTDFYFVYTVKAGDLALPLRLLNAAGTGPAFDEDTGLPYYLLNCSADGTGHWFIGDGDGASANFFYGYTGLPNYTHWPTGDETTKGPATNWDLHNEGAYIKTVEFGDADPDAKGSDGKEYWREVYAGLEPNLKPTLRIMGGTSAEATTVYLCCTNDSVELLASGNNTLITTMDGLTVLKVPVPAGSKDNIPFSMKGAETAKEGDVAKIFMSPVPSIFSKTLTGELEKNTVFREVCVGKAPQPTVQMRFENNTTMHDAVTADADYQTAKAQMILKVVPAASGPVTVTLSATVGGSRSLSALYSENLIRIPDGNIFDIDGKIEEVTIPAGETVTLNLYVLGASEETEQGLNFKIAKKSGPDDVLVETYGHSITIERAGEEGLAITKANPAANTSVGVTMGETKTFKVQFSDTWKNVTTSQAGYKGYTFYLDDIDSGDTIATAEGVKLQSGWFSPKLKIDLAPGTYNVVLWAMAPDGLTTTDQIPYTLVVGDSKHVTIEPTDGRYVVGEGDALTYKLGLNQQLTGTASKYIFLKGLTEADAALISTSLTTTGAKIDSNYQFVTNPQEIRYLDGGASGTTVSLQGFVANSPTDSTDTDAAWSPGSIQITVTNKPPQVKSLMIAGQRVTMAENGKTLVDPVSSGVPKTFKLVTVDEVAADLDTLDVMWVIDGMECVTHGHPTNLTSTVVTNFPNAKPNGAVVQVYLKDKDMLSWPADPNFECRVTVNKKPYVDISTSAIGSTFVETDKSVSTITVALSEPATAPVTVRFKVSQVKDGGFLSIRADGSTVKQIAPGEYDIAFDSGVQQVILIVDDMDGTNETLSGLDLTAEVTTEELNPDGSGVKWKDYYNKGRLTPPLRVENVPPTVIRPTAAEAAYTNENASADVEYKIWYGATDVANDMRTVWNYDGLSVTGVLVTITIDGVQKFLTSVMNSTVGSYAAVFEGEGDHIVEIAYTDKDQMTARRTLNFKVKPSKRLELRAHGPAGTVASSGGFSMHYGAAAGLGAGRVWAGTGPRNVKKWVHSYSFGEADTTASAFAFGYKADGRDDDGTLDVYDAPIDSNGNLAAAGAQYYNYTRDNKYGKQGYDSFLYGWACNNTESTAGTSGTGGNGTGGNTGNSQHTVYSFLLNIGAAGETQLPLPAKNVMSTGSLTLIDDTYPMQYWEAVFSREWKTGDNCGDINYDGIPDWAVYTFGMGVVDTSTYKLITSETQTGTSSDESSLPEGDLTDLKDWNKDVDKDGNDDPDYLPATETAAYAALIPGLKETWVANGVEFGAKLEIRGYHDGLNNALELLGATDIESDSVYAEGIETEPGVTNWVWTSNCTISEVEFAAWSEFATKNGYGVNEWANPTTGLLRWSPERPTKPTKSDTDGDKFPDGYEYYFWYKAHVGYMDNGVHKYLTGRAYDPRNPGEGRFISSATIARMMDPRSDLDPVDFPEGYVDDSSSALTRDTDNDGLPDLLELEIGTNPFDFDTDGDGLPDGWEVMISGTDPLKIYTTGNVSDAMRNFDGDAMAFTTPALESLQLPLPLKIDVPFAFALVKADGDTDGVQWYVGKAEPKAIGVLADEQPGTSVSVGGVTYVTSASVRIVDGRLAADLPKEQTWTTTAEAPDGVEVTAGLIALMPTRIPAGTPIDGDPDTSATYAKLCFTSAVAGVNTAWIYGRETVSTATTGDGLANQGGFGMLAIGRYEDAPKKMQIAALPKADETVAYLHYLVYQEFGFDPRTAWNANTPLASRWGGKDNNYNYNRCGYAGVATRTREYTAYDEFLVYSFFLNNGMKETYAEELADNAPILAEIWYANTTNPQGPGETVDTDGAAAKDSEDDESSISYKYWGRNSDNGADTDGDGVPDGWELYVMAGPKVNGKYHFAAPYNDGYYSSFGPFVSDASDAGKTDNLATSTNDSSAGDGDGLTELQEFAGTDSCAWYSRPQKGNATAFSTTIVRPAEHKKWMNKFFPSDPWTKDTDGDGIIDSYEITTWTWIGGVCEFKCGNFLYGTPVDDGSISIPGGGLNPLSVDTDGDGLPDLWEAQFAGSKIYEEGQPTKGIDADGNEAAEGNPRQGLCDGMDGTVSDAVSSPIRVTRIINEDGSVSNHVLGTVLDGVVQVVNRDYDNDGLENWQEYMTGLMRCWRYDDPKSGWSYIPDDWYWNEDGAFEPKLEMFGFSSMDEFWTETLANPDGRFYNPHLVSGMNPGNYMTRVKNGWDLAYRDEGSYYWLYDRIGDTPLADLWGHAPLGYASCSPIDSDSDQDGMDDYYELFHGLNPLLGLSGKEATSGADDAMYEKRGPCDLIYSAYVGSAEIEAWSASGNGNSWQSDPALKAKSRSKVDGGYDFVVYPWLNGLQLADPDGDDIRNVNEAIMPKLATETWNHTDPSPLWMTDSSYSNSLVRLFFRMPARFGVIGLTQYGDEPCFSNTLTGAVCYFRDYDDFRPDETDKSGVLQKRRLVAYKPDSWSLSAAGRSNWMFSFEENEGYDTDHDGISDYEEGQGKYRSATDMQDFDSPRRRQAMYFPGKDAALQTPPLEIAHHPVDDTLKSEPEFLTYTVECWVLPEDDTRDQVILERAIWTDFSKPGDEEFMRKNFQLAIRKGKWYTKFDPNGTLANNAVEIYADTKLEVGKWAHLAATFDGSTLNFYVNGIAQVAKTGLSLQPEHGESVLAVRSEYGFGYGIGDYWFDRAYGYQAIVVGASVRGRTETGADGKPVVKNERGYLALDLSRGIGWDAYAEFFKGYVDEIRIWDGAREFADILGDYTGAKNHTRRYTRETALENRSAFYKDWSTGKRRAVRGDTLTPELRYHWSFDSLFAAENTRAVAKVPHGFDIDYGAAYLSRPAGYTVDWWRKIVEGDDGTAGYGSVYAGKFNWVAWIPNTVAHLPFYDGTTLDSQLWSETYCGNKPGTFTFPRTAEPVSRWTQMVYNGIGTTLAYQTTGTRHRFVNRMAVDNFDSTLFTQFEFANRNLDLCGADLLPLGGAFAKYLPDGPGMWDEQGASSMWEQTQTDDDNNGIADWWDEYADQNYRLNKEDSGTRIDWDNTQLNYHGVMMSAGEAYLRDLAKGYYLDAYDTMHPLDPEVEDKTGMQQTAKDDGLIPKWWKELMKIDGEEPLADTDRDGLNNYVEYVASELLPFQLRLRPTMASSDTLTLDYFRKVGSLYLGEMLTDHDQMEDEWERSLEDETFADPTLWDALKDADGDGWANFAENRYNGYAKSIMAQVASHAVGDLEALDAPIPAIKLTVRYNGSNFTDGEKDEDSKTPNLIVRTFTKDAPAAADAEFILQPGVSVEKEVYMGGWEDRIVRGTLAPGNIDLGSVNIKFAQVPQTDLYSWTDESGTHLGEPFAKFKEAFDRDPNIIQNIQDFDWLELSAPINAYTSSDKAVTVTRDALTQKGEITVYGERVGTIDLTTGDFTFDMAAMMKLRVNYTFDGSKGKEAAWSYKEAIFKMTYSAKIPTLQTDRMQVTLAKPDTGFVKGGKNTIMAFFDNDDDGDYTPGEPFGVLNDVDIGWFGRTVEMELTDMSAVTPRLNLWEANVLSASDRAVRVGSREFEDGTVFDATESVPAAPLTKVRVARFAIDGIPLMECGVDARVIFESDFDRETRGFLQEGDFLKDGALDVDWGTLYEEGVKYWGAQMKGCEFTNVAYLVVFGDNPAEYEKVEFSNMVIKADSTLVTRRFERYRTRPTPVPERAVFNKARPTFAWRIDGEDVWAARFGTTYTAFKVVVKAGDTNFYESPITRLPAKDSDGVYSWTAPICVGSVLPNGKTFENLENYTWEVALYNAKFYDDEIMFVNEDGISLEDENGKGAFSDPESFRMNVTTLDTSSRVLAVGVRYAGPATNLVGKVRVQAFESPDFTGDPIAEVTLDEAGVMALAPSNKVANAQLIGLSAESYFLRAYIDTNGNRVHDEWESWGYLSERDLANSVGIFNPEPLEAEFNPSVKNVRQIYIEDCDTDGDWFPDVWEAEQNGGEFVKFLSNNEKLGITGQGPVTGDAELIGVNTNLDANLTKVMQGLEQMARTLNSANGVALMAGIAPANVAATAGGFEVKSEVDPETLTIVGLNVDTANGRVLLKVGAETTANIDPTVASFLNVTVKKGAEVTVKVEHAESPVGPWSELKGVGGTVTVDKAGADIEVDLDVELPAQGYFRAKIEE